jgi:hypothetical protein
MQEKTPTEPLGPSPYLEAPSAAPQHLPTPPGSHRETDEDYPVLVQLDARTRIIDCKDGMQWILQRKRGRIWFSAAYCRTRGALARAAGCDLGSLPAHHDGIDDNEPTCGVCGRIKSKPQRGLPRHLFCRASHE